MTPAGVDRRHTILPQHRRPHGQPADARHRRGEYPHPNRVPPRRAHRGGHQARRRLALAYRPPPWPRAAQGRCSGPGGAPCAAPAAHDPVSARARVTRPGAPAAGARARRAHRPAHGPERGPAQLGRPLPPRRRVAAAQDVVAEQEDVADRDRDPARAHLHHLPVRLLLRRQLLQVVRAAGFGLPLGPPCPRRGDAAPPASAVPRLPDLRRS